MPLSQAAFAQCANLSREAYYVLHNNLASYHELSTDLSLEDAFNLIEFHQVSKHNTQLMEALSNELANS